MGVLGFLTALATLLTVCLAGALTWFGRRKLNQIERKSDEIHVLVNSRLTAVLERVDQLTATLEAENVEVPEPRADKHL